MRVLKIGIIILILSIGLGYLGVTCYANLNNSKDNQGIPKLPDISKAPYAILVKNDGLALFTQRYEQEGDIIGGRVFTVYGYYEWTNNRFQYRDNTLVLKEILAGEIIVRRR